MIDSEQHMERRARERDEAAAAIDQAIQAIESQGREPDAWERHSLVMALAALAAGAYGLTFAEVNLALTPSDERSPQTKLPADPFYDECNVAQLRKLLRKVRDEPVRRIPFGA